MGEDLNELVANKLEKDHSKVKLIYDEEAEEYARKFVNKHARFRGYTDIDSYFATPDKPVRVLIFNSKSIFVYGTIAHELEHVKQLLEGHIQPNDDRGKFACELAAYKAGRIEIKKYNKWLSLLYFISSWLSICEYFIKYEIIARIKRTEK